MALYPDQLRMTLLDHASLMSPKRAFTIGGVEQSPRSLFVPRSYFFLVFPGSAGLGVIPTVSTGTFRGNAGTSLPGGVACPGYQFRIPGPPFSVRIGQEAQAASGPGSRGKLFPLGRPGPDWSGRV